MHTEIFLREFAPLASGPGGIQKLRDLVLQLAVRGKLVPQIADEGDARVLLSRLKLCFKKQNTKADYPNTTPLFEIPTTWQWTTMAGIGRIIGGGTPKSNVTEYYSEPGVPWLTPADLYGFTEKFISRGKRSISELGLAESSARLLPEGSVLFSSRAPIGYSAIAANPLATNQGFKSCVPFVEGMSEFILIYLRSSIAEFEKRASGTTFKEVSGKVVSAVPFPLPPIAEQERIVAKVDELMALCDELEARQADETELKRATAASALHHLTESQTPEEIASRWSLFSPIFGELFDDLETIKGLRAALSHLGLRGELVEQRDHEEPPVISIPELDSEPPYALPGNWQWVPFSEIATFQNGDRSKKYPNKSEYVPEGVPWINTGHIEPDGSLSLASMHYITEEKFESLGGGKIQPGDLVYCLRGATFGKTAYVEPFKRGAIASSLMIIRPGAKINRRYAYIYLTSPLGRQQLKRFDNGTAQPNLSAAAVKKYLVPLPPSAEQNRIVAKIDELMALCDGLEKQVQEGERLNAELMASLIYALTETDPDGGGATEPIDLNKDATEIAVQEQANQDAPEAKSVATPHDPETKSQTASGRVPSVDTKFQEAVLVAAIVNTFFQAGGEPIGNFRLQKAVYFARRNMGEHVGEMAYLKKAAGPYNPSMKYSGGIAIAKQKNWLREARGRFGFGHVPGQDLGEAGDWINTYGYGAPALWVAEHFRYKKNEEWETLATVDYAIEHLQAHGIEPDAAQILQYIASDSEWRPKIEKLRLTEMSVGTAMLEVQALFNSQVESGVA